MSNQSSVRLRVRLIPEDWRVLRKVTARTGYKKSVVVRTALELFKRLWNVKRDGCRIVLRNDRLRRQTEVYIGRGRSQKISADGSTNSDVTLEVRLPNERNRDLVYLVAEGAAATKSDLTREALAIYCHILNCCSKDGWQLIALSPKGDAIRISA